MKPKIPIYFFLISLTLFSCIERVDPIEVDETHLVIFANLEYPADDLSVYVLETSNTTNYESKPIKNAKIRLYSKSKDGKSELLIDEDDFDFYEDLERHESKDEIQTEIGNSYWLEVEVPGRKGVYKSTAIEMVKTVKIQSIERVKGATRIVFKDPPNEPNQYLAQFFFYNNESELFSEMIPNSDTLFDGNTQAYLEVSTTSGNRVIASLSHMDPEVYEFFFKYTRQLDYNSGYDENDSGDPGFLFLPPPIQLSGNIYNETTKELVLGNFGVINYNELDKTF